MSRGKKLVQQIQEKLLLEAGRKLCRMTLDGPYMLSLDGDGEVIATPIEPRADPTLIVYDEWDDRWADLAFPPRATSPRSDDR